MAVVAANPVGVCVQYGEFFTCSVQAVMSLVREIDVYYMLLPFINHFYNHIIVT